jgi:hypothetical protein
MNFSTIRRDQTSFNREGFVNTLRDLKQPLYLSLVIEFLTNEKDFGARTRT